MRGFILNMIMVFIGFYLTIVSMFLANESFKRDSIILTMIESAKIASIANLDDSARVEENYVDIIDMTFEENFEKLFYKIIPGMLRSVFARYHKLLYVLAYKYLKDKDNKMKAVRIRVTDSNDTEYQTVLRENTTDIKD